MHQEVCSGGLQELSFPPFWKDLVEWNGEEARRQSEEHKTPLNLQLGSFWKNPTRFLAIDYHSGLVGPWVSRLRFLAEITFECGTWGRLTHHDKICLIQQP